MPTTPPIPDWIRRAAFVSTSRADAGIYRSIWQALVRECVCDVTCLAGGTHNETRFGRTIDDIDAGINTPNAARDCAASEDQTNATGRTDAGITIVPVDHFAPGDTPTDVARTAGRAVDGFSEALAETRPDLVFVLGDRTEMLAASLAALIHRIPIAHLHGGDVTVGAYDNQCRHAISMLSHIHFTALPQHAERIRRFGEAPWRVHTVGAPALDAIAAFRPEPVADLASAIGIEPDRHFIVALYHPETLADQSPAAQIAEVVAGIGSVDRTVVVIDPNADVGREAVADAWRSLARRRSDVVIAASMTRSRFWSCLSHADALIGNSSAGIIEAASFKLPVVNIGDRQRGRIRPANVLDVRTDRAAVNAGIDQALDSRWRAGLKDILNPYGDGRSAERVLTALRTLPSAAKLLRKE